jgi:hypothetical protein
MEAPSVHLPQLFEQCRGRAHQETVRTNGAQQEQQHTCMAHIQQSDIAVCICMHFPFIALGDVVVVMLLLPLLPHAPLCCTAAAAAADEAVYSCGGQG